VANKLQRLCIDGVDVGLLKKQLDLLASPDMTLELAFADGSKSKVSYEFSAEEAEALSGVLNMVGEMLSEFKNSVRGG
jgi:hypothetical protein